ncbi:hypothetical protein TsFJ059_006470, partial [Trichoderma semiorbis]
PVRISESRHNNSTAVRYTQRYSGSINSHVTALKAHDEIFFVVHYYKIPSDLFTGH